MGAVSSRRRVKPSCAQAPAAGKKPPARGAFRPVAGNGPVFPLLGTRPAGGCPLCQRRPGPYLLEKGDDNVISLAFVLLGTGLLYLCLLEDRFRLWTTVGCYGAAYVLSLGLGWILSGLAGPLWACAGGALLFFLASLFLSRNNPLQKLYLVLLTVSNTLFLQALVPPLLGTLPFSPAGIWGEVLPILLQLLLTGFLGLCLYHPFHHFQDRGPSAFLGGVCLLQILCALISAGRLDPLFRYQPAGARVFWAGILYLLILFLLRSVYQAGRFRQRTGEEAARTAMLDMESGDFSDLLAVIKEARDARKAGEYALDTVQVMLQDGNESLVPAYAASFKENSRRLPLLAFYSENPYVGGVIAAKAAFCAQNHVAFESSAKVEDVSLPTVELCVLVNEMLTKACLEASQASGEKKVRFAAFSTEGVLTVETVYSGELPNPQRFSPKGKTFSQLLAWLFDDRPREERGLQGLDNTLALLSRYSGKLSVSSAPGEILLRAVLRF